MLGGLFPLSLFAKALPSQDKTLELLGQSVHYQLHLTRSTRGSQDGEAFLEEKNGERIGHIVLNMEYLEREAELFFNRFEKGLLPNPSDDTLKQWNALLQRLGKSGAELPRLSASERQALKDLQFYLEQKAWGNLFRQAHLEKETAKAAKQEFIKNFVATRLRTLEFHEATHILDLQQSHAPLSTESARDSELKAFQSELRYGHQLQDVLAQALSGFLEECRCQKNLDFSAQKVALALPEFEKSLRY